MAKIFRDSSVLNQFGSPSINSNTFANRPAFGQSGRLFVSTDTLEIYRDTGSAWDNLTNNVGNIGTLQQVTTNGNTTTVGIFAGSSGTLTAGRLLEVKGKSLLTDTSGNVLYIGLPSITPNTSTLDVYGYTVFRNSVNTTSNLGPLVYAQYELNYAGTQLTGFANSIFAQDIYNVSTSTSVAFSTQSGTSLNINTYKFSSVSTITYLQPGGGIRAASALTAYSQFQNTAAGTITHSAGITILGIENLGGSALTITNNYQLLINASDEFVSTATITNRWGIYQGGANDNNYFAGKVLINNTVPSTYQLDVSGGVQFKNGGSYPFVIEGGTNAILQIFQSGTSCLVQLGVLNTISPNIGRTGTINNFDFAITTNNIAVAIASKEGNFLIGTSSNTTRKLVVAGEAEFITTVATGPYTTIANYLPIWVNGVQYYLALLN